MIWLLWAFLLFITPAHAQCSGVFSAGTVCGVGGTVAAPPGMTKLSSGFTTPLVTPTADGQNVLFQNGTKSAYTIYGPAAPAGLFDYDNIRSVIDIESGTTVQNYNAYGAWIYDNVPSVVVGGNTYRVGVGLETYCVNVVAGATCFGLNPALTDTTDGTSLHSVASTMGGGEVDLTTANSGSSATGLSFVLQGPQQPTGANAIKVGINNTTVAQWVNGFAIDDGAIASGGSGIVLGTNTTSASASLSSDSVTFNITDTGSTEHHITLSGTPNGTASQLLISDALAPNGIALINGTGANAAQVSAAGAGANINLILAAKGTTGGVTLFGNTSAMFDCNITNSGYCTVTSANGLALNNLPIVQGNVIISNVSSGYELTTNTAGATTPTFAPTKADLKAGIGADVGGDVSIIANNAGASIEQIRATGAGSMLRGGGSAMFDCNITFSGYCTITSTNGLAMDGLSVIQVNQLDGNNASGFRAAAGSAGATAPTLVPNKADLLAGIGADAAGDLSLIIDRGGAATEAVRITSQSMTLATSLQYQISTTGAGTQTFTNSPCAALTTERWIPVKITGLTSTFYLPACS